MNIVFIESLIGIDFNISPNYNITQLKLHPIKVKVMAKQCGMHISELHAIQNIDLSVKK